MEFILFMIAFALLLALVLWLVFRSGKPKPSKKPQLKTKKISPRKKAPAPANNPSKPVVPSQEFKRKVATELMKRNPDIVTAVIKQWLREK